MKLLPRQWVSRHWNQNLLCNPLAEILHYKRQVGTPRPYLTLRVSTSVFLKTTVNIQVEGQDYGCVKELREARLWLFKKLYMCMNILLIQASCFCLGNISIIPKANYNVEVSKVVGYNFRLHRERKVFRSPGFYAHSPFFFSFPQFCKK